MAHIPQLGSASLASVPHHGACRAVAASAGASPGPNSGGSHDLLIVGPGVLGSHLGTLWRRRFPDAKVVGLTNTPTSHDKLVGMGLEAYTRDTLPAERKFPYVAFCAPPSGSADYGAEVSRAIQRWDGSGSFVFTSSMSVCSVADGSVVTEKCAVVPQGAGPGTDKLLAAEAAALQGGGNVLRLVGLYHQQRGAHTYFIKMKDVARPSNFVVNLIHYEDAARLADSVLAGDGGGGGTPYRQQVFLGSDNHPLTFKVMMDACASSGLWSGAQVNFTVADSDAASKRVDNSGTRAALGGWTPLYDSFVSFMQQGGRDVYNP